MSTFGVVDTGFNTKLLSDIKTEIEEKQRTDISPGLNQSSTSVLGQLNGIFEAKTAELWEVLAAVYRSIDPDSATGEALDNLCALTGVTRLAATKSTVTLTATGTPTTALSAGRVVSVSGNASARFDTLADATIALLTSWVNTTGYVVGDRRTNSSKAYQCITAGTSAGSGGPITTAADITDGTVHWKYLGAGTGAVDVAAQCQDTGVVTGVSGTLSIIETPVSGWSTVTNLLDAHPGTDLETDAALRLRRRALLTATGTATTDAIRADVLEVADVTESTCFENTTDTTDGDGVPPHAIEVLVKGGTADAIAQAIWNSKAGGIAAHGVTSGTAVDTLGNSHTVAFTRPSDVNIYHVIDIRINASTFPSDGDTQIKEAVAAYGLTLHSGDDVVSSAHYAAVFSVSGVVDVADVKIGTAPAPSTTTTLVITSRQLAVFDTSRITVNHL